MLERNHSSVQAKDRTDAPEQVEWPYPKEVLEHGSIREELYGRYNVEYALVGLQIHAEKGNGEGATVDSPPSAQCLTDVVGKSFSSTLRKCDLIFRLNDTELLIVLPYAQEAGARVLMNRLRSIADNVLNSSGCGHYGLRMECCSSSEKKCGGFEYLLSECLNGFRQRNSGI